MRELGKVIAQIPARAGSKRVKAKNLRYIAGKPLLSYSIAAAKNVTSIESVYVNSDSEDMLKLAQMMGVKSYKRSPSLASDTATGDQFTADFIEKMEPDTLVMVNPVCPLVTSTIIDLALEAFKNSDCDTLITCESTQMQTFCDEIPVNIDPEEQLRPTQDNPMVKTLNWAVTIWDANAFIRNYTKRGYAYIGEKRLLHEIDPVAGIKISNPEDFKMCEIILLGQEVNKNKDDSIVYWTPESTL